MTDSADVRRAFRSSVVLGFMVAGLCLSASACKRAPQEQKAIAQQKSSVEIIGLPNGGSIAARPGSPEQAMAAFFASDEQGPRTFRFANTQFKPWSDALDPRTRATVSAITLILRAYPKSTIRITGYTDNVGDVGPNQILSDRRAAMLKQILVDNGIAAHRIETEGKGMADPIGDNNTDEGKARNRRIELTVQK